MAPVDGLGRESSAELVPVLASQASCSQVGFFYEVRCWLFWLMTVGWAQVVSMNILPSRTLM